MLRRRGQPRGGDYLRRDISRVEWGLKVRLEGYAPLDELSARPGRRGVAPGVAVVAAGAVAGAVDAEASSSAVGEVVVAGHCQAAADRRRRATPPPALRRCGDALVASEAAMRLLCACYAPAMRLLCGCYAAAMLVYAVAGVCLVVGPLWHSGPITQ